MSLRDTVQNVTHTSQPTHGRRGSVSRARPRAGAGLVALGVVLALAALVLIVARPGEGASLADARAAADSALAQVDELTARVETLETELEAASEALDQAEKSDRSFADRLEWATVRIEKALDRLRKSTAAATTAAESAAANSSAALAKAEEAARSLSVLQERYDYHLRRYHGGG